MSLNTFLSMFVDMQLEGRKPWCSSLISRPLPSFLLLAVKAVWEPRNMGNAAVYYNCITSLTSLGLGNLTSNCLALQHRAWVCSGSSPSHFQSILSGSATTSGYSHDLQGGKYMNQTHRC